MRAGLLGTDAGLTGLVVLIALALMWVFSSERIRKTLHTNKVELTARYLEHLARSRHWLRLFFHPQEHPDEEGAG